MTQGNIRTGKIKTLTSQIWKPLELLLEQTRAKAREMNKVDSSME
jgi:hypothetical protein